MKRILALTLCLGLVAPFAADAQGRSDEKKAEKALKRAAKAQEKAERRFDRGRGRGEGRGPRLEVQQAEINTAVAPRVTSPEVQRQRVQAEVTAEVNTQQRRSARGDWRNRRGPRGHLWSYSEARRQMNRHGKRDRSWWRSNYNRFALFGGGYYYWDRGYWYPAYGYDPRYSNYVYDEPIYGYNQMEPGRVLRNVQIELRRMGYYRGAIDGLIGPMTRSALTRFQRDNGLPVTRRIDGPTLAALGLV